MDNVDVAGSHEKQSIDDLVKDSVPWHNAVSEIRLLRDECLDGALTEPAATATQSKITAMADAFLAAVPSVNLLVAEDIATRLASSTPPFRQMVASHLATNAAYVEQNMLEVADLLRAVISLTGTARGRR